jgi:hypothetical protein
VKNKNPTRFYCKEKIEKNLWQENVPKIGVD